MFCVFLSSFELRCLTQLSHGCLLQEIHGVAEYAPEEYTTEKLQRSLHLLSEALACIKDKPAYDKAQEIASNNKDSDKENFTSLVNDEDFRLKFLRAEQFNPQKAAERMVKNLNLLDRYLGTVGLSRPICISDLDTEGLQIMKAGTFQLLPFRDRTGRRIAVRIGPLGLDFIKNEKSVSLHKDKLHSFSSLQSTFTYYHTHQFPMYHVFSNRIDDENAPLLVSSPFGRRGKSKAWIGYDIFSLHQLRSNYNFRSEGETAHL